MTAREKLDKAAAKYRRTYDLLYVASQKAGSAAESEAVDAKLRAANAEYDAAKAEYAAHETAEAEAWAKRVDSEVLAAGAGVPNDSPLRRAARAEQDRRFVSDHVVFVSV